MQRQPLGHISYGAKDSVRVTAMVSESTNLDSIEHDRELVLLARAKPQEGFIAQGPMVRAGSPRSDCWRIVSGG